MNSRFFAFSLTASVLPRLCCASSSQTARCCTVTPPARHATEAVGAASGASAIDGCDCGRPDSAAATPRDTTS